MQVSGMFRSLKSRVLLDGDIFESQGNSGRVMCRIPVGDHRHRSYSLRASALLLIMEGSYWPKGTPHSRELPRWLDPSKIGRVGGYFRGPPGFRGLCPWVRCLASLPFSIRSVRCLMGTRALCTYLLLRVRTHSVPRRSHTGFHVWRTVPVFP